MCSSTTLKRRPGSKSSKHSSVFGLLGLDGEKFHAHSRQIQQGGGTPWHSS